jgi:hypothetical protein
VTVVQERERMRDEKYGERNNKKREGKIIKKRKMPRGIARNGFGYVESIKCQPYCI